MEEKEILCQMKELNFVLRRHTPLTKCNREWSHQHGAQSFAFLYVIEGPDLNRILSNVK